MNEEPKNMWNQPWRGAKAVAWFAILIGVTFVIVTGIGLLSGGNVGVADTLLSALAIACFVGVVALLVLLLVRCLSSWRNLKRLMFGLACLATLVALAHAVENWRGFRAWRDFEREASAKGERFDLASIIPAPVPDEQNFAFAPVFDGVRNEMDPAWRRAHTGPGGLTNLQAFTLSPFRTNGPSGALSVSGWTKAERVDLREWQRYYRDPKWDGTPDVTNGVIRRIFLNNGQPPPPPVVEPAPAPVINEFPTTPQPQSPAADVLLALSKFEPVVAALREASQRPKSRFPVRYEDLFNAVLPYLAKLKGSSQYFALHAIAELAESKPDLALEDLRLSFQMIRCTRDEPLLISHLVRIAQVQLALQPVWEGLADRAWNEAQLTAIEKELAALDFLADYQHAMRGERAFSIATVDYVRREGDLNALDVSDGVNLGSSVPFSRRLLFRLLVPVGWFEQNKLMLGRMHLDLIQPAVDQQARTVSPATVGRLDQACRDFRMSPYNWFARMLIPVLGNAAKKFAIGQASVDLARVACALERYRLAHGSYPETLDVLSPNFLAKLPHDVISGQPLKYRRTAEGQFVLYSVGWNATDEGGLVVLGKGSKPNVDWERGDWVWTSATK